jgi:hypothetical protein
MISVRDYIESRGSVDGKQLLEDFSGDPFGWSADTTRYIVAAMLMAGELKLKVSGREVTAAGPQAIDVLKTNNSFKPIGIALRAHRPSNEMLARAAQRLTDLVGDTVIPLEQEISKSAAKALLRFQHDYGTLSEKLSSLGLAGSDRGRTLAQDISDVLLTDASDASQRFGAETSTLYDNLKWALEVKRALENGLDGILRELQTDRREIEAFPDTDVPGDLRRQLADEFAMLSGRVNQDDFYKHGVELRSALTHVNHRIRDAVIALAEQQKLRLKQCAEDLQRVPEWKELTQEERGNVIGRLDGLVPTVSHDMAGLKKLLACAYNIGSTSDDLRRSIQRRGQELRLKRIEEERARTSDKRPAKFSRSFAMPGRVTSAGDLDALIQKLQELRAEVSLYAEIELTLVLGHGEERADG